jgi:hypothetical protein
MKLVADWSSGSSGTSFNLTNSEHLYMLRALHCVRIVRNAEIRIGVK